MVVWIGIDDTDSREGGCTTYVTYRIVGKLLEIGYNLIGYPRLVRLNPNIPWKTRGNGSVSFGIGKGKGKRILVGSINGREMYSYIEEEEIEMDIKEIEKIVEEEIESLAYLNDKDTNPGYVISSKKPPREFYERCVKKVVSLREIINALEDLRIKYKGYKNKRGLIGAFASISWEPVDKTYELITYRFKEKWGSSRFVDKLSVIEMDKSVTSTFDNYDYENDRVLITPNSPCPILFGIRGDDPDDLIRAKDMVLSEDYMGWMLFETNQGTDDHIERKRISEIEAFDSVVVEGVVEKEPYTIEGGHVIFRMKDANSSIDCTAYEPTKGFRDVVRKLKVGDVVEVYGGVREEPFTINVEKIRIKKLAEIKVKVENPVCDRCKIHMKSLGKGKGYRCKRCGAFKDENQARYEVLDRKIKEGFYEVPPCARRHLSKPLKRIFLK